MELTNRILEILEKSGLTPSEFADKIEVQRSAISHITSGRNKPSLEFLMKLKKAFPEIDTDWLIFGTKNSAEQQTAPTLFEQAKTNDNKSFFQPDQDHNLGTSKKVKRVVLFYDDGTFEDFSQSKDI